MIKSVWFVSRHEYERDPSMKGLRAVAEAEIREEYGASLRYKRHHFWPHDGVTPLGTASLWEPNMYRVTFVFDEEATV